MKTQAWGWLTAAVLAAGLNSSYHNGGLQWAHEIADRVEYRTGAVLALATGRADQFLTAEQSVTDEQSMTVEQTVSDDSLPSQCKLRAAVARIQSSMIQKSMAQSHSEFDRFEAMSAREEAQLARLEANRARMEAQIQSRLVRVRIPAVDFNPVVVRANMVRAPRVVVCPRVRVNIPRVPRVKMPSIPVVNVDYSEPGPI